MPDLTPETLAELRRLAELARDLPGGSNWLHGEVADGTETVSEWIDKCSADPGAPAAGRLRLVWSEGSGETKVIVQAIVGDTETAPIRAAFMANANPAVVLALLDAAAERDALAAKVERLTGELVDAGYRQGEDRAELGALRSMIAGRCLSDITHRDEEQVLTRRFRRHLDRQSVCMLPEGHAPLMHDDCMGCTWTDADHWEPSAIDALAAAVERVRVLADHTEGATHRCNPGNVWECPACWSDRLHAALDGAVS